MLTKTDYAKLAGMMSLGSIFLGAITDIGNGPNFMVKSLADSAKAPASFFG